jgi:hypothetical protein
MKPVGLLALAAYAWKLVWEAVDPPVVVIVCAVMVSLYALAKALVAYVPDDPFEKARRMREESQANDDR